MTEEEATEALKTLKCSDSEIALHHRRIRMQSKGYWSKPDAKAYIESLGQQ
jgi:hypothetical protein